MHLVEVEHRASELHHILVNIFGQDTKLHSHVVSQESPTDVPESPTWAPREGERLYLYRGFPNGHKVELAVTERVFEHFGVLEILRTVWASDSVVELEGHRTLVYVDDGLLRYRPIATVH